MSNDPIDTYLEMILRAAGARFQFFDPFSKEKLRAAMRAVLEKASKQPPTS